MSIFEGVVTRFGDGVCKFSISKQLYTETAVFKTCYVFIDKCYLYLKYLDDANIEVTIKRKDGEGFHEDFSEEFLNELINQRLRVDVNKETGKIRELLIAKSLFEGDLVESKDLPIEETNEVKNEIYDDPKKIGKLKGFK